MLLTVLIRQLNRTISFIKIILLFITQCVDLSNQIQLRERASFNRFQFADDVYDILMFLPHFDVLCDLLLNRRTATWNLFALYNKELKKVLMMTSCMRLSSNRSWVRTNQNACITELII